MKLRYALILTALVTLVSLLALAGMVSAQEPGGNGAVSADEVNAVAQQLYCPVCENVPLDVCPTLACQQWRDEIRIQLEQGRTPEQVIDDFVARYGDRVVGTPQDPLLRALSLLMPWIVAVGGLGVALAVFMRWRRNRGAPPQYVLAGDAPAVSDDDYRARLEQDLRARR